MLQVAKLTDQWVTLTSSSIILMYCFLCILVLNANRVQALC